MLRRSLFILAAALLSACASKGPVQKPEPLAVISKPELKADVRWRTDIGAGQGQFETGLRVSTDGERLYSANVDGTVVAIDAASGKRVWKTSTRLRLSAGPSLIEGQLVAGSLDGDVVVLDSDDGTEKWRNSLPGEILAAPSGDMGVIVVRTGDGRLYGLESSDGSTRWSFDRNVPPLTLRGMAPPVAVAGGVVTGHDSGRVTVVTLNEGGQVWEQVISAPTGRSELERLVDVDADLLVFEDWLYVASYGGDVVGLDLASGAVRWRRAVRSHVGMTTDGDRLFVTASNGELWALDRNTGVKVWHNDALKFRRLSKPILYKGNVVVADGNGRLHWFSPADGRAIARYGLFNSSINVPLRKVDGQLIALSRSGEMAAVGVRAVEASSTFDGDTRHTPRARRRR